MNLRPARIAWREDGTPFSPDYGDIYHSAAGGDAQARHVFLGGNGLPQAWRSRERYVILETGFGLGTNFLATWAAWRDDPQRCERLFYVALDLHPPAAADLRRMHGAGPHAGLAGQLIEAWPVPVPGLHALRFDDERVVLLLGFGAAESLLPELVLRADAYYLDGFAPARNPAMWSPAVMRALARLAAPGATLATYTAARAVRDALTAAGFDVTAAPGYAHKRDMTVGRYAPKYRPRSGAAPVRGMAPQDGTAPITHAIVIGAGLAGCAAAHALAARGIDVTVFERAQAVAAATSGNRMGALQPMIARDDNRAARYTRAGYLDTLARLRALRSIDPGCAGLAGLLHLAGDADEEAGMADTAARLDFAPDYLAMLTRAEASTRAGVAVSHGGWWFPQGGWVIPPRYAAALLAAHAQRITLLLDCAVHALARTATGWRVHDGAGRVLAEAPAVVVATAHAAAELLGPGVALQRLRGQVSELPATSLAPPRLPVTGDGYVLPARDGVCVVGATYEHEDIDDPAPRVAAHAENLERVARLLAGQRPDVDPRRLAGRVGWRAVAHDRLPLAGLVHDAQALAAATTRHMPGLAELPRQPGLACLAALGSRGMAWAGIGAALIAAQWCGDPWPVERSLAEAVDPGRFALRRMRRPPTPV